jgi:hypothetical protein
MRGGSEVGLPLLLAALALALAAPAAGEVYRCQRADGSTLYTGDPRQCPAAEAHETTGRVHVVPSGIPRGEAEPAQVPAGADDGAAAAWRSRKAQAEAELAHAAQQLDRVSRAVALCNRGGSLWTEDEDTGLRRDISCDQVRSDAERLDARARELRAYLAGGLEEECRRAGCLPGWIR